MEVDYGECIRNCLIGMGVIVAIVSVAAARSTAKKKQTADLLFASRSDDRLQRGYDYISEYSNKEDKNIGALAFSGSLSDAEASGDESVKLKAQHADAIRYVMNHFEAVSVGIDAGIYDEVMLKKSWCSIVLQTFERTQPLIAAMRRKQQKDTILQEFEAMAARWKRKPLKRRG